MESHQLINQTSDEVEIITPREIISAAREVLGEIDLDPASSEIANATIGARQIFTAPEYDVIAHYGTCEVRRYRDQSGLSRPWCGRVWMSPPLRLPDSACEPGCARKRCLKRGWHTAAPLGGTRAWVEKLEAEYGAGRVSEALCITFASTSEKWFRPLYRRPFVCPDGRTNYMLPDGTVYRGVTKGSAVTYFGMNVARFARAFAAFGEVKVTFGLRGAIAGMEPAHSQRIHGVQIPLFAEA